jgi:hypothetical protein
MHYNHPWPHAALIMDYLVSDVYYRSDGKLDFPAEYAEGYAYCRSKVYGAEPGTFYDGSKMALYMPPGLATSSNVQVNYVAARGDGKLYLMLTNQSRELQKTTLKLDAGRLNIAVGEEYAVEVWEGDRRAGSTVVRNGAIMIDVPGDGVTALAIDAVKIRPAFQTRIVDARSKPWQKDHATLSFGGEARALLFNFGPDLQSVYSYIKANGDVFKRVTLHYANDGEWKAVSKDEYPFEFTVDVPRGTNEFRFRYEALSVDGQTVRSAEEVLRR